jgi:hypothetical protein
MGKKQIILVKKGLIYLTFLFFLFTLCSCTKISCKIRPDLEKIGDSAAENIENLTETNLKHANMRCKY